MTLKTKHTKPDLIVTLLMFFRARTNKKLQEKADAAVRQAEMEKRIILERTNKEVAAVLDAVDDQRMEAFDQGAAETTKKMRLQSIKKDKIIKTLQKDKMAVQADATVQM